MRRFSLHWPVFIVAVIALGLSVALATEAKARDGNAGRGGRVALGAFHGLRGASVAVPGFGPRRFGSNHNGRMARSTGFGLFSAYPSAYPFPDTVIPPIGGDLAQLPVIVPTVSGVQVWQRNRENWNRRPRGHAAQIWRRDEAGIWRSDSPDVAD